MIIDDSIKQQAKEKAQRGAYSKPCPSCGIVGLSVGKVYTNLNYLLKPVIRKGDGKPTLINLDRPFDLPVELICPQCNYRFPEESQTH